MNVPRLLARFFRTTPLKQMSLVGLQSGRKFVCPTSFPVRLSSSHSGPVFPQQLAPSGANTELLSESEFLKLAKPLLDYVAEQLEDLPDDDDLGISDDYDVLFTGDVLTLHLGDGRGTYVLNTQRPNRQIWLSSPVSGPKRFDWVASTKTWVYRHDGSELGSLLSKELSSVFKADIAVDASAQD